SNAVGVVGVTGKELLLEAPPATCTPPVLPKVCGICGAENSVGYLNSRMISMTARWPLLVVTRGAERRSTPFFSLIARMTAVNRGPVKTSAIYAIPVAGA